MSGCWLWIGRRSRGYGYFGFDGKALPAHRFAYKLYRGVIPEGLELDHLCKTTCCVNPAHLEAVTPRDNTLRSTNFSALNAAKTHCLRGHELTPENVYYRPGRRSRECRRCRTLSSQQEEQLRQGKATRWHPRDA